MFKWVGKFIDCVTPEPPPPTPDKWVVDRWENPGAIVMKDGSRIMGDRQQDKQDAATFRVTFSRDGVDFCGWTNTYSEYSKTTQSWGKSSDLENVCLLFRMRVGG